MDRWVDGEYCQSERESERGRVPVQVDLGLFLADQRGRNAHSHHHSAGFVAEAGTSIGEERRDGR
jgi:hypothetical protein